MVRKDGRLEPCSWDQAVARAAESLSRLVSAGRPVGVLGSGRASNEENFLAAALARVALRTGHLDAPLRGPYDNLLRGLGAATGIPPLDASLSGLAASDLILLLEGDVAATHPRAAFALLQALRRGGRLVTVGWGPTRMSRLAATHLHLAPDDPLRPLRELVDAVRGGSASSPGGDAPAREIASWLAGARRPALVLGLPLGAADVLEEAASLLGAALREAAARRPRGEGSEDAASVVPLPVRANSRGSREMGVAPHLLPGCRRLDDAAARDRLRKVWGAEPSSEEGLPAEEMPPALAGLVVVGDDLIAAAPSPAGSLEALRALDSLVVFDSYLTATAGAATVLLPIAAFGEGWGTLTNLEGRVQCWRPVIRPPGEAREGWMALGNLLHALGMRTPFATFRDVFAAAGKAVPEYANLDLQEMERGPGTLLQSTAEPGAAPPAPPLPPPAAAPDGRWTVRTEGAFDWNDDPLVAYSPTLRRDGASFRRLHPGGLAWINPDEARALGVREGWKVRLRSSSGEAEVTVAFRPDLGRRLLLVPFTFRDELRGVLGGAQAAEVELSRA